MAGIIKAAERSDRRNDVQPVEFNLDDISGKANAYLDGVRQEAQKIVAQASNAASQVIKVAEQQGQQAALQTATKSAEAKVDQRLESLIPALQHAIQLIQQEKEEWLRHWEQNAIQLSIAIAERLIGQELQSAPEIPLKLIRQALELVSGNERFELHLNPQDYQTLGDRVQQLNNQVNHLAAMEIVADSEISVGGCLVKSEHGEIDCQFEAQLERIKQELT